MERARAEPASPYQRHSSHITDASTFVITPADVGSQAVRPGVSIQLEQERAALLLSAKLVLGRIRAGQVAIGAPYEHALEAAIRMAEAHQSSSYP